MKIKPCINCGDPEGKHINNRFQILRYGHTIPFRYKGLCRDCFNNSRRHPRKPKPIVPCIRCGTDGGYADKKTGRPLRKKGYCESCYGKAIRGTDKKKLKPCIGCGIPDGKIRKKSKSPYRCKGMCENCYKNSNYVKRPPRIKKAKPLTREQREDMAIDEAGVAARIAEERAKKIAKEKECKDRYQRDRKSTHYVKTEHKYYE